MRYRFKRNRRSEVLSALALKKAETNNIPAKKKKVKYRGMIYAHTLATFIYV